MVAASEDICPSAMCSLLPCGFVLLAIDSFHDLRWCIAPSIRTEQQLKNYYSSILVPRLSPAPWPGVLFPLYVIYIFLSLCPDWVGWCLFACYLPLCRRYYKIIILGNDDLQGWWMIVGIRVVMAFLTYKGLEERGCRMMDYRDDFHNFIKWQNEEYLNVDVYWLSTLLRTTTAPISPTNEVVGNKAKTKMQAAEHANIEAVVPEEDSKLPAKRPRRKAALKSEERIAEMADDREQEEDVKPPAKTKRRRTTKTKGALKTEEGTALTNEASSSVTINVDAMVNVMEFLPPRSLFNVALTCKSLREMVTTKMVVHSALIHGGNAKKTMEELHKLMSCHSIHVPSPLRLLRLANGTKCEFCVNKNVNSLYEGLNIGAFSCWDCIAAKSSKKNATLDPVTKPWKTSWARYWTNPVYRKILNHPRVGFRDKSKGKYLWSKFRHDADGKKFGPIVRFQDIDAMAESKEGRSATAAAKAASSAAVGNYGASRLAEQTALANTDWNWIDQYLTDHLDAPPKEDYAEFIEAYTDITERAQRVVREKAAIKRAKKAKIEANRQVVGQQLVSDVTALIDEPFRARAMERSQYGRQAFVAPFVDNVMKPYVGAVSKIKKNTPTELAKEINSVLRGLDELLAMKFLSDEDAFETAAKAFFRECFPNVDSIMEKKWCLDTTFHDFMKQGLFFQALCSLKSYKLSPVLLASEPSASLAKSATFLSESSLRTLAGRAWDTHFAFLSKESFDSNKNTQAFQASHVYFGKVLARLGRYFKWLEAKREAAKTEEELRIWERDGDCKTKINAVVGYGYWTSNHFDFFMWQDDFEQVFKYQTDYTFRCEQNRVGGWSRA